MHDRLLIRMCGRLMACGGLLCALAAPAHAGSATSAFPVQITLTNPQFAGTPGTPGNPLTGTLCINQALSQASQATVTVVCSTNQFVSIQPFAGGFLGTPASAYRFVLNPDRVVPPDQLAWPMQAGAASTLQVIRKKKGKWAITGMQKKDGRWEITEIQINY